MPGINDTHYHPILNGMIAPELDSAMVDTGLSACKTIPELLDLIRRIAATKKPGQWISTMGYEAGLLAEQRHPTLEELDAAAPNNPLQCAPAMATLVHITPKHWNIWGFMVPRTPPSILRVRL